jgi:ABC-type multidrug transport system fused ATPase/permease subunit
MKEKIKELLELLTHTEKKKAVWLFVMMFIGALLEIFSLGILPAFIAIVSNPDLVMQRPWLKQTFDTLAISNQKDLIRAGAIFIILVFIAKNAFAAYLVHQRINYTASIQYRLSSSLLRLYYNAPYTFHLNRNTTDLFSKVSDEVRLIVNSVLLPLISLCMDLLFTVATLVLLLAYEPLISCVSFLIFGVAGLVYWFSVRKKALQYGSQLSFIRTEMFKRIYEGFGGLKDARILNREQHFIKQTIQSFDNTIKASTHQQIVSLLSRPFIETLAILGMLSIVLVVVAQGRPMSGVLTVLALFAIAAVRLLPSVNQIIAGYTGLRSFLYTITPVYNDIKLLEKEEQLLTEHPKEAIPFEHNIVLNEVSYRYPNTEQYAVSALSLTIPKGNAIGFVGTSGSGKTTLVDMILGLLKPVSGTINVDDKNVFDDIRAWQQHIGYIPQQIFLSDNSIRRNIAFGIEDSQIDEEKIHAAINAAQLETLIQQLPEGLDTEIGERGVRISGGQRQRIGIARALYHNPQVLIMDEATSALDNVTEKYVIEAIERLKGNRTIITIAHRLSTVKNCDTLYLMKQGKIIAHGTYNELLQHSEDFKDMHV